MIMVSELMEMYLIRFSFHFSVPEKTEAASDSHNVNKL